MDALASLLVLLVAVGAVGAAGNIVYSDWKGRR